MVNKSNDLIMSMSVSTPQEFSNSLKYFLVILFIFISALFIFVIDFRVIKNLHEKPITIPFNIHHFFFLIKTKPHIKKTIDNCFQSI